jgi:recombination protein RecA
MPEYDSLQSLISSITKKYGEGIVVKGSEVKEELPRISTGILAFDLMLGGGWPVNQWSEIIGEESSGKTAIAYKTIAANQALDPNFTAVWIAAEDYVPDYAKAIGVDLDRLWVFESNIMEQVYDFIINLLDNRAVDLIVVDSLPALVPGDEAEKMMDEFTMGLGARLTGKFFRKSSKAQKRSLVHEDRGCTGLMINQWRDKIGVMWGDPRTTPGGKAKNFHYFTRVEVKRDEWIKEKDESVGQSIRGRTLKNKTYRPQQSAIVDFYFADSQHFNFGDFDTIKDIVNIAIVSNIVTRAGAYYSFIHNGEEQRFQGKDRLLQAVREDIGIQNDLRNKVFQHYNITAGE